MDRYSLQAVDEGDELRRYLRLFAGQWWVIVSAVGLAVVSTALVTSLLMTKWYRATAILRPIPQHMAQAQLANIVGGGLGAGALSALGGGGGSEEANAYIAILKSFAFTSTLLEHYHLYRSFLAELKEKPSGAISRRQRWLAYYLISSRFDCEYSLRTGNLTVWYLDWNPVEAQRILTAYVDELREKLRKQEIEAASAAAASLRSQASVTSDSLLQTQLYDFVAKQIAREKVAQVEADFAFQTLAPPAVPYKPYKPKVVVDCLTAAVLAFFLSLAWLAGREPLSVEQKRLEPTIRGKQAVTVIDGAQPEES